MTDAAVQAGLAADHRLVALMSDARPAFLWRAGDGEILWMNAAGAALLGLPSLDVAGEKARAVGRALVPQLAAAGRALSRPGAMRLEKLRFSGGGPLAPIACACRAFEGPDGGVDVLVNAMEVPRGLRKLPASAPLPVEAAVPPTPAAEPKGLLESFAKESAWSWVEHEGDAGAPPVPAEAEGVEAAPVPTPDHAAAEEPPVAPAAGTEPVPAEETRPVAEASPESAEEPAPIMEELAPVAAIPEPEVAPAAEAEPAPAEETWPITEAPPESAEAPASILEEPAPVKATTELETAPAAEAEPVAAEELRPIAEAPPEPAEEPAPIMEELAPVAATTQLEAVPAEETRSSADANPGQAAEPVPPEDPVAVPADAIIAPALHASHDDGGAPIPAQAMRFTFETDAQGHLTALSAAPFASWLGRSLSEIAGFVLPADPRVHSVDFTWQDGGALAPRTARLDAMPVYDSLRRLKGYRGIAALAAEPLPAEEPSPAEPHSGEAAPTPTVQDPVPEPLPAEPPAALFEPPSEVSAPAEIGEAVPEADHAAAPSTAEEPTAAEPAAAPIEPPPEAIATAVPKGGDAAPAQIAEEAVPEHPAAAPEAEAAAAPQAEGSDDEEPASPGAEAPPSDDNGAAALEAVADLEGSEDLARLDGIDAEPAPAPAHASAATAVSDAVLIPNEEEIAALEARFAPDNDISGPQRGGEPTPSMAVDQPASAPVIDLNGQREARNPSDPKIVRLYNKPFPIDRPGLSQSERIAFGEIARALGARIEGEVATTPPMAVQEAPAVPPAADDIPRSEDIRLEEPRLEEPRPEDLTQWHKDEGTDAVVPATPEDLVAVMRAKLVEQQAQGEVAAPAETVPLALLDRLPIGIMVARGEDLLYVNRTLLDLLGYGDLHAVRAAGGLGHILAGKGFAGVSEIEGSHGVLLTMADGQTMAVDGRMQTVAWEGEPALLISVRRPPPEEGAERARLAERRAEELQAVLDTATDGVVILDGAGKIVGINRSAEALFGYETEEIAGKDLLLLIAPESHRAAFDYLDSLKANGVASVLNDGRDVLGRVRQGGAVPLFMTIGRLGGADDNRFCAVLRDMTSFRKAEGELIAARKQAEEASSQKSDFLAKISHEIRTPLNAIIGFAEVMMEERFGPVGNDRYRSYVRDIHASGEHVISLVNDLLDLSKIEAGKLDLAFTSVNVNEVVQQSVAIMQPQANRDRIIIRTALAANLPNVVADGRSIRQIVLNLLSNSIKFTMPGGQVIISSTFSERGEAVLRVRDTGVGMTEKELIVAMEPFRQIATATLGGTGLGLPLTKALVEANRASFTIQSAKNSGTMVEVVFPPTRVLAE